MYTLVHLFDKERKREREREKKKKRRNMSGGKYLFRARDMFGDT